MHFPWHTCVKWIAEHAFPVPLILSYLFSKTTIDHFYYNASKINFSFWQVPRTATNGLKIRLSTSYLGHNAMRSGLTGQIWKWHGVCMFCFFSVVIFYEYSNRCKKCFIKIINHIYVGLLALLELKKRTTLRDFIFTYSSYKPTSIHKVILGNAIIIPFLHWESLSPSIWSVWLNFLEVEWCGVD